jgi:hypothetical protein
MDKWEIDRIKRAIQSCKNKRSHHYEHQPSKASNAIRNEDVKIKALEKQIPKRPIEDGYYDEPAVCPNCGGSINTEIVQEHIQNCETSYCEHCGQAIDWSETE